jgi:hypothetical protein
VDTDAVLGNAMADRLLAVGAKRALTVFAPERVARWLDAHGYRIGRVPVKHRRTPGGVMSTRHPADSSIWDQAADDTLVASYPERIARSRRSPTLTRAAGR